ncbi:hypothetical protein QP185_19505 [Sphingomonas aerolata]|uniref:hypothetical protein n=1 Tax=Sphingomonas aerolata TaxID=185951 RepID=UPI002FE0141B
MTSTGRAVLIRGVMITALALGAGGIPIGATAQAAIGIRIARQDMSTALLAFSRQSGRQILFSPPSSAARPHARWPAGWTSALR